MKKNQKLHKTQSDLVRDHLEEHGRIDEKTAKSKYHISNPNSIIYRLKKKGMKIKSITKREPVTTFAFEKATNIHYVLEQE